jgi:hypothetical protein
MESGESERSGEERKRRQSRRRCRHRSPGMNVRKMRWLASTVGFQDMAEVKVGDAKKRGLRLRFRMVYNVCQEGYRYEKSVSKLARQCLIEISSPCPTPNTFPNTPACALDNLHYGGSIKIRRIHLYHGICGCSFCYPNSQSPPGRSLQMQQCSAPI